MKLLNPDGNPLHPDGNPLYPLPKKDTTEVQARSASVHLEQTSIAPGRRGVFYAVIDGDIVEGTELLFQPESALLMELGLTTTESLLITGTERKVLIPLENLQSSKAAVGVDHVIGRLKYR